MKRVRPDGLVCQLQPPRNPRCTRQIQRFHDTRLSQSSQYRSFNTANKTWKLNRPCQTCLVVKDLGKRWASAAVIARDDDNHANLSAPTTTVNESRTSGQTHVAGSIARLSALHARLQLPPEFPLNTLARCLIHVSADSNPARNNASLAVLGQDLLAYYTSEHIIVTYPRLPVPIIFAAQYAYSGPAALAALRAEWGVELATAPGPEVNRALLQFKRLQPGKALAADGVSQIKDLPSSRKLRLGASNRAGFERRGMSSRIAIDDEFGDIRPDGRPYPGAAVSSSSKVSKNEARMEEGQPEESATGPAAITAETASATFVRALAGALYLHCGDAAVKQFHQNHILSRHFELHKMFDFKQPTFDLSRLCAREDFEPPIARLLSETGRMSRTPVFVVGVFSGEDKLGEGAGASLNEARVRAAAAALRSWYLYSPPMDKIMRPSTTEDEGVSRTKTWIPQMVDPGEIVA